MAKIQSQTKLLNYIAKKLPKKFPEKIRDEIFTNSQKFVEEVLKGISQPNDTPKTTPEKMLKELLEKSSKEF